ncbi:MAG TPA: hypothetical protein VJ905_05025, partial [Halalkalibaculum sp.]|nr:hypothetical protein [Halalkalibaculum sp.]
YLMAPVYFVFLSLLMLALIAKVIAMWSMGENVVPAIFIIPAFGLVALICTLFIFNNIKEFNYDK